MSTDVSFQDLHIANDVAMAASSSESIPLYKPLATGHFRLLSVLDDSGTRFTMQDYGMDEMRFKYIPLSYTWGPSRYCTPDNPASPYHIMINGQQFIIRNNLYNALIFLARGVRQQDCYLWVDAICINQDDLEERATQVRCMKDIFENASCVFAWLGVPDHPKSARTAKVLAEAVHRHVQLAVANGADFDELQSTINTEHQLYPRDPMSENWVAWEGVSKVLSEKYWERTWIYQEATTPRSISFCYGNETFGEDDFLTASWFISIFAAHGLPAGMDRNGSQEIIHTRLSRQHRSLLTLLKDLRYSDCVDPRDKVFAILPHAYDAASAQEFIAVDYGLSLEQVYIDVVRFSLATDKSCPLEFLSHAISPAEDATNSWLTRHFESDLPSWVPDWRRRVDVEPIHGIHKFHEPCEPLFRPLLAALSTIDPRIVGRALHVSGLVYDALPIEFLTSIWETKDQNEVDTSRRWLRELIDSSEVATLFDVKHAVARCLVADLRADIFEDYRHYMRGNAVDWNLIDSNSDLVSTIRDRIEETCWGRRMGRLRDGHIGVIPAAARIGDVIAVLNGGFMLYVLRPLAKKNEYSFVGECYVDGCMDGQLWSEGSEMEEIVLL